MNAASPSRILIVKNLRRTLGEGEGRTKALRGVDFSLVPGKSYAVTGPSGCGKSTLLYLLGLLDRPDEGDITLLDRSVAYAGDGERTALRMEHIGFVFQFHFLLPEFTAKENVMLPMKRLDKIPEAAMDERAMKLLSDVGLADKADRFTSHLSGGEQQRVAVARALANQPSLVLADEPTGNLDERNSGIVFDLLTSMAKSSGSAVLIVTHNPDLAKRCDEVLHMKDGLIIDALGAQTPQEKIVSLDKSPNRTK
jgi:lipoprotein-releasing system ATP-binding protein